MRSRKAIVVSIVFLLLVVVLFAVFGARKAYAEADNAPTVIPKKYGTLRGSVDSNLIFENSKGEIRLVSTGPGADNGQLRKTYVRGD